MIAAAVAMGTAFALIAPSSALAADATPAAASTGTTYYVSSTHGDDGNAGTDQGHPWKTLDKVNAIATDLKPGDSVLLERGSTFQDQYLHIKDTSGTADAPITIADYGDASASHRGERRQGQPVVPELPCVGRQPPEQGHRLLGHPAQGRVVHHGEEPGDHQ